MCWDCYDNSHYTYKEFRQGAVDPEDFYIEVNYQKRMKGRKKGWSKAQSTRPGCPGNDYKEHVYVWTTEYEESNFFSDHFGFHKYQSKVCAGCGKKNGSKLSDKYLKIKERKWSKLATPEKGVPISRWVYARRPYVRFNWWVWENEDEEYRAARKEFMQRHGYPRYLYDF